jgi:hypothetical protein
MPHRGGGAGAVQAAARELSSLRRRSPPGDRRSRWEATRAGGRRRAGDRKGSSRWMGRGEVGGPPAGAEGGARGPARRLGWLGACPARVTRGAAPGRKKVDRGREGRVEEEGGLG